MNILDPPFNLSINEFGPTSDESLFFSVESPLFNDSSDNETRTMEQPVMLYRHSPAVTIIYCVAYVFVFILGLIGNCLVVAVVFRVPQMRTVTNYFIVNLAIADILVILFCLPATLLSNIFVPWILGGAACKLVAYVQGVSVVASVDSLVAVSLDRVLAICFPMRFQITGRRARLIILVIWVLALTTTLPWPIYFHLVKPYPDTDPDLQLCVEEWPAGKEYHQTLYFIFANVVFCYLLPLTLICLCYVMIWVKVWSRSIPTENKDAHLDRIQQRSKVKVVKMLVVVVIIFTLSWLPLYAIFMRIKLSSEPMEAWEEGLLSFATPIAQWLGASNSCINPVLYAYFNQKYRRGFTGIVKSRSCCGDIRTMPNYNTTFSEASVQLRVRKNVGSVHAGGRSLKVSSNHCAPKSEAPLNQQQRADEIEVAEPLNGAAHLHESLSQNHQELSSEEVSTPNIPINNRRRLWRS